jgi:hypothetical protein
MMITCVRQSVTDVASATKGTVRVAVMVHCADGARMGPGGAGPNSRAAPANSADAPGFDHTGAAAPRPRAADSQGAGVGVGGRGRIGLAFFFASPASYGLGPFSGGT